MSLKDENRLFWHTGNFWFDINTFYPWVALVRESPTWKCINHGRVEELFVGHKNDYLGRHRGTLYHYERGWLTEPIPEWMERQLMLEFSEVLADD